MTATKKLPVRETIIGSYAFLFRNWREAIRIGWLPVIAILILNITFSYLYRPLSEYLADFSVVFQILTATIIIMATVIVPSWLITSMVAVAWHRLVLLGSRAKGSILAVNLGRREWRYLGRVLAIAVVSGVILGLWWVIISFSPYRWMVISVLGFLPESVGANSSSPIFPWAIFALTGLPVLLALTYVLGILWLALPATAVDRGRGLGGAWRLGRGNGWALALVALGTLAPSIFIYIAVQFFLPGSAIAGIVLYGLLLVGAIVTIITGPLTLAAGLSLSYRALGGFDDGGVTEGGE